MTSKESALPLVHAQTRALFSHLFAVSERLSLGDSQFMSSLHQQFESRGELSESQNYHLERLCTKYSMEEISKQEQFEKDYTDDLRLIALRCARYYDEQFPRYYGHSVDKVLCDPTGHTLSYSEFNKMCNNKYAKKILAAYASQLKFSAGDMVQIRANNRVDIANTNKKEGHIGVPKSAQWRMQNKVCMILSADSKPVTRAAKGARIYKILIIDETSPIYAHESDLKKVRGPKKK